jgi:hypothetical protein
MVNHERLTVNLRKGLTLFLIGEIAVLGLAGDASAAGISPYPAAYIDCAKHPDEAVSMTFDAAKRQELYMGDVQTSATGQPEKWRTAVDIDTIDVDVGEIGVAVGGFGPVVAYNALPKHGDPEPGLVVYNEYTGDTFDMVAWPEPAVSHTARVLVSFTCGIGPRN